MRCVACNKNLSDREANRKYANHQDISNPEDRYIGLCDGCIVDTDLDFDEPQHLPEISYDDEDSV